MKREVIFILLTAVLSFNSSAIVFDDFQDGDTTANPRWRIDTNFGQDMVVADPYRAGNLTYKGKGTSTGHRIIYAFLDETMPYYGFDLSYELMLSARDFTIQISARGDSRDTAIETRLRYRTGWSKASFTLRQVGSDKSVNLSPSDVPINQWLKMHCWHDTLTDTIFMELRVLDSGELIAEVIAPATGNYAVDNINRIVIAIERTSWQYVDNINISSGPPATKVSVDIKPGSCPNPVNVKNKGVLPAAILGTAEFDVTTIDPASVKLAGVGAIRSSFEDVATLLADPNDCECTELGPDGFMDLTLKFTSQQILEALGPVNDGDILPLYIEGVTLDEMPITGSDCISIKGKFKPTNKADLNSDTIVDISDFLIFAENWLQSSIVED